MKNTLIVTLCSEVAQNFTKRTFISANMQTYSDSIVNGHNWLWLGM